MNYTIITDTANHQYIIKYLHLERYVDFTKGCEYTFDDMVRDMMCEIRNTKLKKLIEKK